MENTSIVLSKDYIIEGIKLKKSSTFSLQEKIHKYDYVSINMNNVLTKKQIEEFFNFQINKILPETIYNDNNNPNDFGIENDLHITVFYGLLPNDYNFKLIKQFIRREIESIDLIIKGISFFRKEDSPFDVMKFEIESEALVKIHNFIETLSNENTNKIYNSHMTIAYINKGTNVGWNDFDDFSFCNELIEINEIEFQDTYGNKQIIHIDNI